MVLGKYFTYSLFCFYTYPLNSATIKIPLHRLKRDESRVEKTPTQLAIEADLACKKLLDAPYEDLTEVKKKHTYLSRLILTSF